MCENLSVQLPNQRYICRHRVLVSEAPSAIDSIIEDGRYLKPIPM